MHRKKAFVMGSTQSDTQTAHTHCAPANGIGVNAGAYPLTMAGDGASCYVQKVRGQDDTRRFLASLGFVDGAEVSVVSRNGENLIVQVKDARVAISSGMAMRIMVA